MGWPVVLLYQGAGQLLISFPLAALLGRHWTLPRPDAAALMIVAGVAAFGGQTTMTLGLRASRTGPASAVRTTNVLASFVFQPMVTPSEPVSALSLLGATCIACACVFLVWH